MVTLSFWEEQLNLKDIMAHPGEQNLCNFLLQYVEIELARRLVFFVVFSKALCNESQPMKSANKSERRDT